MVRSLYAPHPGAENITTTVDITKGGTGGTTVDDAITNLGTIRASLLAQPNGLASIGPDGKIPFEQIPSAGSNVAVYGSKHVFINTTNTYQITNYDNATFYSITAIDGSATMDKDIITYTSNGNIGMAGFIINDKTFEIETLGEQPYAPVITSPVNNSIDLPISITVTSSVFTSLYSATHLSSDWELSTDASFTTIVQSSYNDTVNKTSWSLSGLANSTTYYIRVRYTDSNNLDSQWSTAISLTIKEATIPVNEVVKLLPSDPSSSQKFGNFSAVSEDGSTIAIGDNRESIYIFIKENETWVEQAKLTASDGASSDQFGYSVAISADGNTIIVGAYGDNSAMGSAYVFTRSGTTWSQQQKLTASDGSASDYFGNWVEISADGNTAFITAMGYNLSRGAFYIFTRSGTTWTQNTKILAGDAQAYDTFGRCLALSNDGSTIAVGAYAVSSNTGAVYILTFNGSIWTQQAKLIASDGVSGDYFGVSVALSGDGSTAIIGAYQDDDLGSNSGSAYIFTRSGTTWTQHIKFTPDEILANAYFGLSLDISWDANIIAISCSQDNDIGNYSGSVYLYIKDNSTWVFYQKLLPSDGAATDYFGSTVCISGDGTTLVSTSREHSTGTNTDVGATYIFN